MQTDESVEHAIAKARALERFHLTRALFWFCVATPAIVVMFALDRPLWNAVSVLYLAVISHYANGATDLGNWQGARAERRGLENPPQEEEGEHGRT